jgi:hypothetical protein
LIADRRAEDGVKPSIWCEGEGIGRCLEIFEAHCLITESVRRGILAEMRWGLGLPPLPVGAVLSIAGLASTAALNYVGSKSAHLHHLDGGASLHPQELL